MSAPGYSVVQYPYRNPDARSDLLLTLIVVPNTSPEQIVKNITTNSALPLPWLKFCNEQSRPAMLVGGGPSAADHISDIRALREKGGTIFATNGASRWLRSFGFVPDWQVIADPKEETATLVDTGAFGHLFSSAVDPATMTAVSDPVVWHRNMEGIANLFPEERLTEEYCLIGGTSAGTHAMCIAYAMGHRELHCFGFDSSHREGASHAYAQPMNDSIETCQVDWAGKTYQASIAMKAQAENFMITARAMQELKVNINVYGDGLLPTMWNTPPQNLQERDKYRLMWGFDSYRTNSPSEDLAPFILAVLQPDGLTLDFGCGTGRASLAMAQKGVNMLLIDFADNCRDHEALTLPFLEWDLTEPLPMKAGHGFCCDVMEHIPTDQVAIVLENIMAAANKVFFSISTVSDSCGALIQHELHLTVRPHEWWAEMLGQAGTIQWQQQNDADSRFVLQRTLQ